MTMMMLKQYRDVLQILLSYGTKVNSLTAKAAVVIILNHVHQGDTLVMII